MTFICPNCGYSGKVIETRNEYICQWCHESITKQNYLEKEREFDGNMYDKFIGEIYSPKSNDSLILQITSQLDEILSRLPKHEKATDEYINKIKITPEFLIDNAMNIEDFVPAAAIIRRNIEKKCKNIIGKREDCIVDKEFYIKKEKYDELFDMLKRNDDQKPHYRVYCKDEEFVELPPYMRFYLLSGQSKEENENLSVNYTVLNDFIHYSERNAESHDGFYIVAFIFSNRNG